MDQCDKKLFGTISKKSIKQRNGNIIVRRNGKRLQHEEVLPRNLLAFPLKWHRLLFTEIKYLLLLSLGEKSTEMYIKHILYMISDAGNSDSVNIVINFIIYHDK